jgi:hypothetical protein
MLDDARPTLTITSPQPGINQSLNQIVIGMHDAYTGLDQQTFHVSADQPIAGRAPGTDFSSQFREISPGVWSLSLGAQKPKFDACTLTVSVRDRQGNETRIVRKFSVK